MAVSCKVCGKQFDSFRGLNGHMNAHLIKRAEESFEAPKTTAKTLDIFSQGKNNAEKIDYLWGGKIKFTNAQRKKNEHYYLQLYMSDDLKDDSGTIFVGAETNQGWMRVHSKEWKTKRTPISYNSATKTITFLTYANDSGRIKLNKAVDFAKAKAIIDSYNKQWDLIEASKKKAPAKKKAKPNSLRSAATRGGRKAPTISATKRKIGTRMRGNDGNMWQVKKSGKSQRWMAGAESELCENCSGSGATIAGCTCGYMDYLKNAEGFRPREGKKITRGRKQRWIPHAIEYIKTNGPSTSRSILPSLPDSSGSGRPYNGVALSNRLIRMPDIFKVNKTTQPYTFSLVDEESFSSEIVGKTFYGHHPEDNFSSESVATTSKVKVYVEREDNQPWKYVTLEIPTHIVNDEDLIHEAIEARLMDILQEPFGGWDLISVEEMEAESFEANYNPEQVRDGQGRWTDNKEIDLDSDELSALADAIREQDETFPDVSMLLEQIGDTPANRQQVFQEMLVVLSGFVNGIMDTPEVVSHEEYFKYILDEPIEDIGSIDDGEINRIYQQANYYAQIRSSLEIEVALEDLYILWDENKGTENQGAIERDINFVELVSRVQNMQRDSGADGSGETGRHPSLRHQLQGHRRSGGEARRGRRRTVPIRSLV